MNNRSRNSQSLPATNQNEDLETISRSKLSLLFDVTFFEVRPETIRDKGIDLIVELKQDNCYTNFQFAIQLKSTNSTPPNKDGSFSYPIAVSNINYLSNFGKPAYYILHDYKSDRFYIKHIAEVQHFLNQKYARKKLPKTFTV